MKSVLKRITRSSAFPAFVLMVAVYVANTFLVKGFTGGALCSASSIWRLRSCA